MLFKEVIGQQPVKKRIIKSVKEERVSHAQLISGPPGSGGLPLALAFAQYITCENKGDDSCGICPSCIKNAKMIHPDVHYSFPVATVRKIAKPKSSDFADDFRQAVIENPYLDHNDWGETLDVENKQLFISVDESADLLRKLQLKTFESLYKVVILWMPEKLRHEASNKLLKIIEEPPDRTLFLLVTENSDMLLPTVLSRLQIVKINRLNDDDIKKALIAKGIDELSAHSFSHLADGDYHTAMKLAAEGVVERSFEDDFIEWMRLCFQPSKATGKLLSWVDARAKEGREKQKQFLAASIQTVRECIITNVGPDEAVRMDDRQKSALKDFLPFVHTANVADFVEELNKASYHIERNANAKVLFLDLSFRLNRIIKTVKN